MHPTATVRAILSTRSIYSLAPLRVNDTASPPAFGLSPAAFLGTAPLCVLGPSVAEGNRETHEPPSAASLRSAATQKTCSHKDTKAQRGTGKETPLKLRGFVALCENQLFLVQVLTVDPKFAQKNKILTSSYANRRRVRVPFRIFRVFRGSISFLFGQRLLCVLCALCGESGFLRRVCTPQPARTGPLDCHCGSFRGPSAGIPRRLRITARNPLCGKGLPSLATGVRKTLGVAQGLLSFKLVYQYDS